MNLRKAAQQALEALEDHATQYPHMQKGYTVDAITALRAALSEDTMQRLTDEQQMIERGTKAWAHVPSATEWVEDLRGNQSASLTIEEIMCLPYYKTCAQLVEKVYTPMLIYFAKDVEHALNKRK